MAKGLRLSLANKCQLLFGAAVVLILSAVLTLMAHRMGQLVDRSLLKRAQDYAEAWLADEIQFSRALTPTNTPGGDLPERTNLRVTLMDVSTVDDVAAEGTFPGDAIKHFVTTAGAAEQFAAAIDGQGQTYYRYAMAMRQSDLMRMNKEADGSGAGDFQPVPDAAPAVDPLRMVLLIDLRDRDAAGAKMLNHIYLVVAGLAAGLLAIGVFWFITMRIILSPVRLLRDYAAKVSEGNLNIRADINTGDEFEQLSDMFNTMLEKVKNNDEQLRSVNKSLDLKLGELAESNVALYEANKIKGEFLANVSHELRTPLNAINGFAQVLADTLEAQGDQADEKCKRYINNIISSTRLLLDLINALLDLAKIEAGRMDLRPTPLSVTDTTEGLLNLMRPAAEKAQLELKLAVEANMPVVLTDAGKLQQILFNFLSNAVKFTPAGGKVTLGAVLVPSDKPDGLPEIHFTVSDTGMGIAIENQRRIFDKFIQLDPGVTKEHGGTGLGLTISSELAQMLQGRIEVDSDLGRGATFILIIPTILENRSEPLMPDMVNAGEHTGGI
jgi:two-component system sensor histidine kinase BarA